MIFLITTKTKQEGRLLQIHIYTESKSMEERMRWETKQTWDEEKNLQWIDAREIAVETKWR